MIVLCAAGGDVPSGLPYMSNRSAGDARVRSRNLSRDGRYQPVQVFDMLKPALWAPGFQQAPTTHGFMTVLKTGESVFDKSVFHALRGAQTLFHAFFASEHCLEHV